LKLGDIAKRLGLPLEGGADVEIRGLAALDDAGEGELAFVTGPRYRKSFEASRAAAFLVPPDFDVAGRPCLRTPNPYADFARVVELLLPAPSRPETGIHPTAVVGAGTEIAKDAAIGACVVIGPGSRIGARSVIHPNAVLYSEVVIGEDTVIHSGAQIRDGVRIGSRVTIDNGAVIGSEGFGYVFLEDGSRIRIPHRCSVEIGDDTDIGANTTIDASHPGHLRYGEPETRTRIGRGVKIDNLVQVAHGCVIGDGSTLCSGVGLAGRTEVGKRVMFGGQSASRGDVRIGDGALVGARAGVASDLEPGEQVLGAPHMERRRWGRAMAVFKRLPELMQRVRRLEKRLGVDEDK
jgi:UDP-3-O-[3-hydroxymyristoyl] glucosamine N-acyltransferase